MQRYIQNKTNNHKQTNMKKPENSIELKMTWIGQMKSYIMFMEMGDDSNRKFAKDELMKLATKLDKYNEANDIPFGYLKPSND